ncbi:hypothetical protein BCV72DRAFT_233122 [Rhizopus microsporus var. microsporus]|uniref:Uncharacterized protein n=1 Tax=Rhizopus microsporus var. microsporus TaxID=86635 RepID=A0A1X0QUI2_RHIZD|nr:hypothetical protein BCV72DRAFT_233122 [Rhizopus microsporus var. microsporus]
MDFLTYIKRKKTKICVIAIEYAGLTANMCDLKNLLIECNNIQKIVIDLLFFFYQNCFKAFDRHQL